MDSITGNIAALAEDVKAYVETRADLLKLEVAEKASVLVSNATAVLLIGVLLLCFVAFAGVGLALLVGIWTGKLWAGFLIVSVAYALKALFIWKLRNRWIRIPVMNHFLKTFFNEDKTGKE